MKAREARTKVILPARLRWDGRWVTATVRNVSSRGLMLAAAAPPPPGAYVEIQIAALMIVARTVWVDQQFCGFQSRERLNVAALCGDTSLAPARSGERRAVPRGGAVALGRADDSRRLSSLFQYAFAALFALSAAGSVAWEVHNALSAPLTAIGNQL